MAAIAETRAKSMSCSLNILAGAALDNNVRVLDSSSKRKRPCRNTDDVTHLDNIRQSHQLMQRHGEHEIRRRSTVYDDLDPMLMASDPEVNSKSSTRATV